MKSPRRRVRAATVELIRLPGGGLRVVAPQPRALNPVERMAAAGELGDVVSRLLEAAEWFSVCAAEAHLRGRLAQSSLVSTVQTPTRTVFARVRLARLYEAIGADAFNVLVDAVVWEQAVPGREALLRAALHGVMRFAEL
jgi:hypothetical protein